MSIHDDGRVSLADLYRSVLSHKFAAALVFAAIFALFVAAWQWLPRKYESGGEVYVQVGRGLVGLSPTLDQSRAVSIQDTRETEIRSVAQLIESRGLLEQVVDAVGAEQVLASAIKLPVDLQAWLGTPGVSMPDDISEDKYKAMLKREKAVKHLARNLNVTTQKKTSVISVSCTAATPYLAQEIVDSILHHVQQKHVEVNSIKGSRDFFEKEYERQSYELKCAEEQLRDFRDRHNFLSVDQARETLNGIIDSLENQLVDVSIDLKQSGAMVAKYLQEMATISRQVERPHVGLENSSTESAQTQLFLRMAERARLVGRYSEDHPLVIEINKEIARLEREVQSIPEERTEFSLIANPVFDSLQIELVKEEVRANSLSKRLEEVKAKHDSAQDRLRELNELKVQSDELQRSVSVAQQYLDIYSKKRGESIVNEQLDRQSISDVVVAQAASLVLKKAGPKGSILLPLGALIGAMSAVLVALILDRAKFMGGDQLDHQIEGELDIPVMVTVPRVHPSAVVSS